ncbi:PAS domain S-box protein [uncultured Desulfobacter sp.]|uniref:PAS domain-containing protein n=1 Tax=uncultured Desulfobacter sp. TaxID=240139 RepID=UPI0029F4D037|nr:PAS domain S-box protein [uncultured Desulfobacter sp.]
MTNQQESIINAELFSAFNAMASVVWIIDKDNFIRQSNNSVENLFNKTTFEVIGKKCWEVAHGTDQPVEGCPISKARHSLQRESMEFQIGKKCFEVVVDPILNAKGRPTKYIHIITDITENKQIYTKLRQSQRLLANSQRLAKIGGWEWDVAFQKMYWTKELYRLHGFDPKNFDPGSPYHIEASLGCYKREDRSILLDAFWGCVEEGIAYDLEFEFKKLSGEKIWIRTTAESILKGDKVKKVIGNVIDVTEFKMANDALLIQSERIKTFFNSINEAIFVYPLKKEGFASFMEVNHIACKQYGYTYDEFLNISVPNITVTPDVSEHGKRDFRKELIKKGQLIFETTHIKKTGETFPVEINSNIFYQNRKPYILALVRDITERKENEKKQAFLITELQEALENIKTLRGLLPICSICKKIRDDKGYWNILEGYIEKHSEALFSHGICPECSDKLYGDKDWYIKMKKKKNK